MLSKNMYLILSCFPRNYADIAFEELLKKCKLSEDEVRCCLNEILFLDSQYIRSSNGIRYGSNLSLTEVGLVKVEAYEYERKNMNLVKASLITGILAMAASVASAVAAFIALYVQ